MHLNLAWLLYTVLPAGRGNRTNVRCDNVGGHLRVRGEELPASHGVFVATVIGFSRFVVTALTEGQICSPKALARRRKPLWRNRAGNHR